MKKLYSLMALAMTSSMVMAQSYKLTDMSAETFAAGGDAQWSFQKYEYGTGVYSAFSKFGTESTCNYLDQYLPERVMGERISIIDGFTTDAEGNYWAGNMRQAWYDEAYAAPRTNSNDKFIYMSEDFETYANPKYAGVVSFTIPADGYYKVSGSIVRQDCFKLNPLYVIPRYRMQGIEQVDSAITMGLAFAYGDQGGELEGWTNCNLNSGAEQRFVAQVPTDYDFTFYGKQGDVVSFETNAAKNFLHTSWVRDIYGRSFFKKLDIEAVDQAAAEANERFRNPYDMTGVDDFKKYLEDKEVEVSNIEANPDLVGDGYGQYSSDAINAIYDAISLYYDAVKKGKVNAMNLDVYKELFDAEWQKFLNAKATIDYTAEGNFVLFTDNANLEFVKLNVTENNDNPFGYYWYDTNSGEYNKFETWTKTKGGKDGWCRNNGEWMYFHEDGSLHPDVARTPAVLFTAPADGYYNVGITIYRPNPNTKVENPLYLRTRFLGNSDSTLYCPKDQEITSQQYGSVANDGMEGKAPVNVDFYAHLKKGDKISADIDCYTSGRNSSAASQYTRFVVASMLSEGIPVTKEFAESTGLLIFDPYVLADMTALQTLVDSAKTVDAMINGNVGEDEGQYGTDAYNAFVALVAKAGEYIANPGETTQYEIDIFSAKFQDAISAVVASRKPFNVVMPETTAIRLAGTDKYIVQKDVAGDHYYAAIMSIDDIAAAVAKKGSIEDYLWTFTVNKHEDGGYYLLNENGVLTVDGYISMLPPNPTETFAAARLNFVTENQGDSLVAISRYSDGKYWEGKYTWKSPYDMMNLNSAPQYKFIICDAPTLTPAGINDMQFNSAKTVKSVEYYTIDGRRVATPAKGIVIKRTIHADGTASNVKLVAK